MDLFALSVDRAALLDDRLLVLP